MASITGRPALGRQLLDALRDAMGAENRHRAGRDLVQLVDEHRAARAQILDHVAVVHDFVTDIDRRAVFLQRPLDDLDRPLDAGAKAAGLGQDDANHGSFSNRRRRADKPDAGRPRYGTHAPVAQCRRFFARMAQTERSALSHGRTATYVPHLRVIWHKRE